MGMAIVDGSVLSIGNHSSTAWIVLGTTGTTAGCSWCGWPASLCSCQPPALPDMTRLLRTASVETRWPEYGWYREFDRAQPPATLLTNCATAVQRIWRRLRGHDALQVRRFKRRRFVQLLATA